MTILLRILLIFLGLAQTMAIAKGSRAYPSPKLTDAGVRIGSLVALPITIYAFYAESWILWIISFVAQLAVQDSVSELELNRLEGSSVFARVVILAGLVIWYMY